MLKNLKSLYNTTIYLKNHKLEFGLPEDSPQETLLKGLVHEYGTKNIPRRPWLSGTLERKKTDIRKIINKETIEALKLKYSGEKALSRAGIGIVNIIRGQFLTGGDGTWEKLADSTVRIKGNSTILVETGDLRRSIFYKIKKVK